MSGSPSIGHPARSLRVQITAVVVVLLVIGLVAAGLIATIILRGYLISRIDDAVASTSRPFTDHALPTMPPPFDGPRLPSSMFIALVDGNGVLTPMDASMTGPVMPPLSEVVVGQPMTLASANGQWRALFSEAGTDNGLIVVAASLADVNFTVDRLVQLEVRTGALTVVLGGALGYALVSRRLAPLATIDDVANEIAAGDLARRVPELRGSSEVERLAHSVNAMVDRISEALTEARAKEELMRRFVADAGHELRTPLTGIRGFAELAATGGADPNSALAHIEVEAARMGLLVEDLQLLARVDAHRPFARQPIDLSRIVDERCARFAGLEAEHPITWRTPANPVIVVGDEARLSQVLDNLLRNVAIHTPPGTEVSIDLTLEANWVRLTIADTGPGMESSVAARVFERFFRADTSRTRATGGTGLGLAIVEALVHAHAGTIELETAPGQGSTFTITLPRG